LLIFRLLEYADCDDLVPLFEEMQAHYDVFCPPREAIVANLRNLPVGAEILIAKTDRIVGFAAFSAVFPGPGLKPGMFLKELFVSKSQRDMGIGKRLMMELGALALERGLSRIDWTADRDDVPLLNFYDNLGAIRKHDKLFYRLDGHALQKTEP
jgi:GNAT superfamily N-acetyltransferase